MSYTKPSKDDFFSIVGSIGCERMERRRLESVDKVLREVCDHLMLPLLQIRREGCSMVTIIPEAILHPEGV